MNLRQQYLKISKSEFRDAMQKRKLQGNTPALRKNGKHGFSQGEK